MCAVLRSGQSIFSETGVSGSGEGNYETVCAARVGRGVQLVGYAK